MKTISPVVLRSVRISFVPLLALIAGVGCREAKPEAKIAKAAAPTVVQEVARGTIPKVKFVEITREAGIDFVHTNGADGEKLLPETMGSGVAFLDFDGDGDQDLFLVNSQAWPGHAPRGTVGNRLYRNDGKGHFDDATKAAGLDRDLFGMGVAVGDIDNDGDPDLYVTALGGGVLYRNDGGKFVDVTAATNADAGGGWLTSAAFFDLENDGDLDLFVCRYVDWSAEKDRSQNFQLSGKGKAYGPPTAFGGTFCTLLRNDGGKFADVSESAGIRVRTPDLKVPTGKSLGVAPQDIDGDGLVDLAVANDTVPNFLFHNLGGGRFEELGVSSGVGLDSSGVTRGAMGIDWSHFKNDKAIGLAIGNFANEMTALYVADPPAGLLFSDQANQFGLGAPTQPPLKFGLFFFDYDLDGRPDMLSANGHLEYDIAKVQASQTYAQSAQLFWNTGGKRRSTFAQVGPDSAGPDLFAPMVGRGSAYADIDGDGDLDVVITANGGPARLFRNDASTGSNWIRLSLKGRGSNRDGIGARVVLETAGVVQDRQLFGTKGYLSSSELPITLGLGTADRLKSLRVVWPSGRISNVEVTETRRTMVIEESTEVAAVAK